MEAEKKHHGTGKFVPKSVQIIDFKDNNLLVRGSSAFGAEGFELSDLYTAITSAPEYSSTGITLSANPMIIDFCLVGYGPTNHKDERIVAAEVNFFNATNPPAINGASGPYPTCIPATTGSNVMIYWPILSIGGTVPTEANGSWSQAAAVDASIHAASDGFDYAGLVSAIHAALSNKASLIPGFPNEQITEAIIYVHCDSGINRTGAAIIGYLMKYGSNIAALGIPVTAPHSYNTLQAAQTAAQVYPIQGNTPVGGVDQAVPEAYCNFLNTGNATSALSANCVPLSGSVN